MNPIDVTPCEGGYRVINGRRRVFAAKRLGRTEIMATIYTADMTRTETRMMQLTELVINWEWPF